MEYRFQVKATAWDFFMMSMKRIYKSPLGVCNIVFFVAAILLTLKFYQNAGPLGQPLMILMCLLIPAVQPLGTYFKAKSYALAIPEGLTLEAGDKGIRVEAGERSEDIGWKKVSRAIDTGECVILKLSQGTGYFLFNRVLGEKKKDFIEYVNGKTGN
ncbi:MAG: YcxB family protein [Lachnospiraceae bacterium]|nr:YcxB family protein [Lachnospiraceae bacterium]